MRKATTLRQQQLAAQMYSSQISNNKHLQTEVEEADPHKLIEMLFSAIVSHMQDGISAIERDDSASMNKWLTKAQAGVNELRISLRHDLDPEMAANLDNLYEYIGRQLGSAKAGKETALVEECIQLITPVKDAWTEIGPEARQFREDLERQIAADQAENNGNS